MNLMHMSSIDLNLLTVAAALYKHRNVSKAADELALSQSAVSHALARLRSQFDDPFFVRTARGIAPTEYAKSVQDEILQIVGRAQSLTTRQKMFDPATARARISIATTDFFETVVMTKLLDLLSREAPLVQVSIRPTRGELPKRELEEGQIDLAIAGFYRDLPEGFYQSKLFTDDFACAVGKAHPLFSSKKISADEYFEARHALITLQGDFRENKKWRGRERNFVYGTYSFTSLAWALQSADLLLTAPSLLLSEYAEYFPMRVWPSPVDRGGIDVRMVWHAQTHSDPLRVWLREKLRGVCAGLGKGGRRD